MSAAGSNLVKFVAWYFLLATQFEFPSLLLSSPYSAPTIPFTSYIFSLYALYLFLPTPLLFSSHPPVFFLPTPQVFVASQAFFTPAATPLFPYPKGASTLQSPSTPFLPSVSFYALFLHPPSDVSFSLLTSAMVHRTVDVPVVLTQQQSHADSLQAVFSLSCFPLCAVCFQIHNCLLHTSHFQMHIEKK